MKPSAIRLFTKYGGRYTVTMIPGDGVGRELCDSVATIFAKACVPVDFEKVEVSGYTEDTNGYRAAIESIKRNKVALKGMFYTPTTKLGHHSFNVAMRKELDIYASVVLVKNLIDTKSDPRIRHENVDFVVIRENTEGEYSGLEHQSCPGVIESLKVTTRAKSERIVKFAFDYAKKEGRKKITCVHKANIMQASSQYSSSHLALDDMIVDNTAMQLVSKPQQFDVIVTPNLYGNVVSSIGAGLVGGPGFIVGYNLGDEYATFEPGARHVGKSIQGSNIANPTSMILSACHMLKHLGLSSEGSWIEAAVLQVLKSGNAKTCDIGGTTKTTEFCDLVLREMDRMAQ